jgi:DNA-binding winged helix-turn-helix (wHTH) protein/Flp pilus assembly protein TadD
MAVRFAFGPFELDPQSKRLLRGGEPVAMSGRHVDLLCALVAKAGAIVTKDQLIQAAWHDVAVTDNSLEQAISSLRRTLDAGAGRRYIETEARRGYRFVAPVTRVERRESDDAIEALLAPHRAWIEGRAALETLERTNILHAREVFERVLAVAPAQASAHVGLANACALQFEMTRADRLPDTAVLAQAAMHAREACQLDPEYGEAWATLGFVLERTGRRGDALAALRRAVTLEPDNWRHQVRLSYASWGEERLRAASRALTLLAGFPMAHWLAATVHVARQAIADAERELSAGVRAQQWPTDAHGRFSAVALHWLLGLIHLHRGDDEKALVEFERELADESAGQLYARECCANTWYAMGALRLRHGRLADADAAFRQALERIPHHPLAHAARAEIARREGRPSTSSAFDGIPSMDLATVQAVELALRGRPAEAARVLEAALESAPAGNAGWTLPLEPLLRVHDAPDVWAPMLARLRARAV